MVGHRLNRAQVREHRLQVVVSSVPVHRPRHRRIDRTRHETGVLIRGEIRRIADAPGPLNAVLVGAALHAQPSGARTASRRPTCSGWPARDRADGTLIDYERASSSFTNATIDWLTGVGTPSSAPRRTTKPLSASISVGLPRSRSWAVEEKTGPTRSANWSTIAAKSLSGSDTPLARATATHSLTSKRMVSRDSGIVTTSPYVEWTTAEIPFNPTFVISLVQRLAWMSGEIRHGTPAASNSEDTRAMAASRGGPVRPGRSPMSRSPRPACLM